MNTPTMETNNLILRRFNADDLTALFEILKDEKTNKFLPWFKIKIIEEAKEFLTDRFLEYYDLEFAM